MNNYRVDIEIKEDECSEWTKETRKMDFIKENITELDDDNNVPKCWYVILNGVHLEADFISFSGGMSHFSKGGEYGEHIASINNDRIKSLSFRVDETQFKVYNFKF